ncbi:hypothetical protein D623_10005758 [Myotis brandtii]|uniref:Uncharacterized protein n=1 Tax=Myotis brandtii TaxID=109478 RepID=S7P3S9_MYOBR|nr:hypothetical protein D623_10005758 [Myotis brandtii]
MDRGLRGSKDRRRDVVVTSSSFCLLFVLMTDKARCIVIPFPELYGDAKNNPTHSAGRGGSTDGHCGCPRTIVGPPTATHGHATLTGLFYKHSRTPLPWTHDAKACGCRITGSSRAEPSVKLASGL